MELTKNLKNEIKNSKFIKIIYILLIFLLGFIFSEFLDYYSAFSSSITGFSINEPSDFIDNRNIIVYDDKVVILVEDANLRSYDSGGSMLPIFGENSNGISIKPKSEEDIDVGDIISFRKKGKLIVHRVVEKGTDDAGIYFITKGDNSILSDGKIRFSDIEYVLIGLIY